jgi:hypothetical protein
MREKTLQLFALHNIKYLQSHQYKSEQLIIFAQVLLGLIKILTSERIRLVFIDATQRLDLIQLFIAKDHVSSKKSDLLF